MSLLTPNIPFKNYNPTFEEGSGSLGFIEKTTGFVSSSWKSAITQTGTRAYNRWSSQQETSGRMLSPDEANTYFPYKEKYKQPVSYDLAQLNYNSYRREIDDSTFSDTALHEWDGYLAMLLGGLTGSLLDPIEAGSGFIAGGFAASGRLGVNLFKNSSIAKRTLLKSATFGAAESVLLEPLYYALKSYNKEQYGIVDTVSNLGFGAVLGGIGGGIRLATGNYDIPIELKPETIKAVYVNGLLNAEQNIPAKILTEDANFIRSTFKEEINTLVDIEKSKFKGDISKEQEAFIRAKAERVISNGVNKEMPTAPIRKNTSVRSPNIESKTDANLVTHSEQLLNDAKQEISQYNISNEDLKTRKDRVEIEEQTANLIQENKQDPKADFIDKAQSDLDKQLVIEKAFSDTVTEFFPGVEVVNINNAKLNPSIIKNFEDKRNQAGYLPSDGKIYFNPLKIDKEEVGKLIFHEVVTHKGLDAIMTTKERAKFDKYMEKHYKQEIDKSIADGEATTRSAAIEEVIAYRFESEGIQAQEYTSYMYAKAMQVLGIDGKSMKVIDDAIIKETVYQSMKGMATQKLINRFGMFGSVDEWTKEEIFFVNKRRKDILENQKLQEEIIDAENRYFVEKKFKEAQQRGADERTKIVPRVLDKVKNIQEQLDFKLKLTKSKNQKEILKLNELSNKLLLNKTKEKLNKAIDSDKSKKSPVILKFEKHIREKQEEIKELNHTIKLFENSKSNLLNHKKDLELLDKQELALNNIQTNAINRYSKAKIKLKSVSNKKDIQNAYDELETLGLDYRTKNNDFRFRKKTPSKESKQELRFSKQSENPVSPYRYSTNKSSDINLYHGTPHSVDKFSLEKIGTGEGRQAFGYGLYFAEDKKIANWYRKVLSKDISPTPKSKFSKILGDNYLSEYKNNALLKASRKQTVKQSELDAIKLEANKNINLLKVEDKQLRDRKLDQDKWESSFWNKIKIWNKLGGNVPNIDRNIFTKLDSIDNEINKNQELINDIDSNKDYLIKEEGGGNLYKVAFNANKTNILEYDVHMHRQSPLIQKVFADFIKDKNLFDQLKGRDGKGSDYYRVMSRNLGGDKKASKYLNSKGVKGLRFADSKSRKKFTTIAPGSSKYNYVIFNDRDLNILKSQTGLQIDTDGIRFRKKTPSKESKQEAIDFAKDAGQVDQDKKYKASIANLAKPSQLELDNFDNQVLPEINRVAVASKLSNNEKETLEKTLKQLTPLANANARIKLFNWFSKLPQGRRFTAIKDYIERTLDADIKHNKEFYIDRFYNKMNQKFKKKWDTKPFWKEITYAGHYLRNESDKTLDKDILVNMRTPDSDALKAVKEIDNLNKELMGFARNVGLVVQDMEHYTGPQIWSIDRIAKNLNISITEFDIKTLSYKEMKDHKDVIANEVYKKIKDYVRWDRISTPKGDPILDANSGEAKRYIRDWISGLWDHKQSKISGTPAELGVSNSIIGAERKINFIDGDIAHDFQMKWGAENSTDALINNLESLITKTITTKHLGPSAENNLNMVIKELGETIEQGNLKIQKQRRDVENKIPISLRMMTGRHQVSDNHTLVKWLNNYRSATSALKMGNLILTSASDPVYTAKALKNLEIKGQGVSDFLKIVTRRKTREDKFLLENTYATYDGVKSASISRFDPETIGLSTAVSKFNNFAFTYNGMNWHNRTLREGFHLGAIRRMGIASKYSLSQLREMGDDAKSLVARIERSLISDDEWEVIRDSAINVKDLNGKPHAFKGKTEDSVLTWDSVLNEDIISNEQIIKLIKNTSKINNPSDIKIKRTRKELSDKLQSIIRDEMDTGILTPGVRENRIMSWGSKEGSYQNAFLKLLFQYKSFPVAMMTRHLGPTWQENSPLMAAIGISYLVAKATAVTLMVDQIKQLIDGKNVKPWNLDTLGAAIAKSGGLALIYDVLFKDYSEYGQNGVLSHLGGPGLNGISDLAGVGSQFVKDIQDGDFKSSSLKAIRAADQFTGNFPILSQIKKNMVIYPLYDLVDPQRNNRIQNLLEKNWGQKYWADWASPTGKAEVKTFEDLLNLIDNTLKNND